MDIFDMSEGMKSMEEGFSRVKCPTLVSVVTSAELMLCLRHTNCETIP